MVTLEGGTHGVSSAATSSLPGSDVSLGLRGERVEQSREKCLASHGASNDLSAPKKCSLEVSPGISVSEDMVTSSLHCSLMVVNNSLQAPVAWGQFESQVINMFIRQPIVSEIEDDLRGARLCYIPSIPAFSLEAEVAGFLCIPDQPCIHNKIQASQRCLVRPCL